MLLVATGPALVRAQEEGYTEDFEGVTLPGWELAPEAILVDGALRLNPGSFALRPGDWTDIRLSVRARLSGEGEALINYYFREGHQYGLFLRPGAIFLEKEQDGNRSALGEGEASVPSLQSDTWTTVTIVVSGSQHQVYVEDELVLTAEDPEPLEAGAILFQSLGNMTLEIDDLNLQGIPFRRAGPGEGEVPPAEQPGAAPASGEPPAPASTTGQGPAGLTNIIDEFFASQANTLELTTFLINLILAAISAYILGLVYIHWGSSLTNRRKFAANFMLMTITTTFIILVVRSSVALSLGLVGALSIVRFRTAVKDPEELAYLFFAIGIGIGLGDNQRLITMLALAAGIALIGLLRLFRRTDADVNLHLAIASRGPGKVELEQVTKMLSRHTSKLKLLRFDETAKTIEASFLVEFRQIDDMNRAREALKALSEQIEITFMDNKGLW